MDRARAPDRRLALLQELADGVRLGVLTHLDAQGLATASELGERVSASRSQMSNHLRRLREAGLVRCTRAGRLTVYELADPSVTTVLEALRAVTPEAFAPAAPSGFAKARTCFDHLAGRLGVLILDRLVDLDALRPLGGGELGLGPRAQAAFSELGVAVDDVSRGKRRLAFECLDSTEHRGHVGGALGGVIARALTASGWVVRRPDRREVDVTPTGVEGLSRALHVSVTSVESRLG